MAERRRKGRIEQATWRDLSPDQRISPLGAVAMALAAHMDSLLISGRDAASVAKELRATLLEIRREAPVEEKGDAVDDLQRRREARRSAG
jgi:molybdopterin-guanine dinucleotide biosynthesis protein A